MPDSQKNPGQARVDAIFQALKKAARDNAEEALASRHNLQTDVDPARANQETSNAEDVANDIIASKD